MRRKAMCHLEMINHIPLCVLRCKCTFGGKVAWEDYHHPY